MSTTPAQQSKTIEVVGPDTLLLCLNAADHESVDIPATFKARVEASGPFYMIVDLTHVKSLGTGAADRAPDMIKSEWFRGIAYVNASATVKLVLKVFNLGLFLAGQSDFPSEYVKSREEGHAAIDRMRAEHAKASA